MYTYGGFRQSSSVAEFLESIYAINDSRANFNADCVATEKDRILVLSTCLPNSADGRYLVLAKLERETIKPPKEPEEPEGSESSADAEEGQDGSGQP